MSDCFIYSGTFNCGHILEKNVALKRSRHTKQSLTLQKGGFLGGLAAKDVCLINVK